MNVKVPRRKEAQLAGGRLPFAVFGQSLQLKHYSSRNGLEILDPKYFGTGKATRWDLCSGVARIFCFRDDSPLGTDESLFRFDQKYQAMISPGRIYDLTRQSKDPLGYFRTINRDEADRMLVTHGYAGYLVETNPERDGRIIVVIYEPIEVLARAA